MGLGFWPKIKENLSFLKISAKNGRFLADFGQNWPKSAKIGILLAFQWLFDFEKMSPGGQEYAFLHFLQKGTFFLARK